GGKASSSSFQVPNGTKEIDVNGNGDNSIQTNAFNTNQGANCVNFPFIDHTTAVTNVLVGGNIHDQAFIGGAAAAQVTYLQFHLFAPSDPTCAGTDLSSGTAVFTDVEPVDSTGKATSGSFTPSGTAPQIAGTYEWTASYSGDDNYKAVTSKCNDTGEQSLVNKQSTTTPTGQKVLISDFAKPTGFGTPTGTVTFSLFDNAGCTGTPIFTQTTSLVNGLAHADDPTPLNADGTYKW